MIGCLLMPLKAIWTFLRFCFTHSWKGFVVLAIVIIIGVVAFNVIKGKISSTISPTPTTATQVGVPTAEEAPYIVQTSSRYYFAAEVETKNDITTMTGYWELLDNIWTFNKGTLVLAKVYGIVKVGKR